jgi:hypothetical protein
MHPSVQVSYGVHPVQRWACQYEAPTPYLPLRLQIQSPSFFALLEAIKELGFFGFFKVGATLLALYAAYKAIGLAKLCSKLWIER